jgi:hypothetical protein
LWSKRRFLKGKRAASLGWLDHITVGPARHQAVLHFARSRQIASQPQADRQHYRRNQQSSDRAASASALFRFAHGRFGSKLRSFVALAAHHGRFAALDAINSATVAGLNTRAGYKYRNSVAAARALLNTAGL